MTAATATPAKSNQGFWPQSGPGMSPGSPPLCLRGHYVIGKNASVPVAKTIIRLLSETWRAQVWRRHVLFPRLDGPKFGTGVFSFQDLAGPSLAHVLFPRLGGPKSGAAMFCFQDLMGQVWHGRCLFPRLGGSKSGTGMFCFRDLTGPSLAQACSVSETWRKKTNRK